MANSRKAVSLVVALMIMGLMTAFLMPVVLDTFSGQESATYTQEIDEKADLQPGLNATLLSADGTNASYAVDGGPDSETVSVAEGENATVTVDGTDVTIAPSEVTTDNATTTYTYDGTYGWGGGASALWTIIPVLLVLAVFLYFVAVALNEL